MSVMSVYVRFSSSLLIAQCCAVLQVEKNLAFEFDRITEAGKDLKPLAGPG